MLTMSVIITGSLLNMIMNEIEHGKWIMRVGRDTIDLSWIVVVIQSEASVFIFEALLIGWLLKTFCSRIQYSIYHSDFPIEGRVRRTTDRPTDQTGPSMDRPSSPDKRRRKCSWNWIQPPEVARLLYNVFDKLLYLFGRLYSWFDHVKWGYWKEGIHVVAPWSKNLLESAQERHRIHFKLGAGSFLGNSYGDCNVWSIRMVFIQLL